VATNDELRNQNKLRKEANSLRERAAEIEERNLGLIGKLTDKIKESTDGIKEGFDNLGIADKIKDALNVSNKYVQNFVKNIIPNSFSAIGNAAAKAGVQTKLFFSKFSDGITVNEKKVSDIANELEALKVKNEKDWGLKGGAPFLMTPSELKEMNAAVGRQADMEEKLAIAREHLSAVKDSPQLFSKDTLRTTRTLNSEYSELSKKIKEAKNDKGRFNPGFNPQILSKYAKRQKELQSRIEKRSIRSTGKMKANAMKMAKASTVGIGLLAGGLIIGIIAMIGKAFTAAFDRMIEVQNAVINFRKQFGFTVDRASKFSKYLDQTRGHYLSIGLSSDDVATNSAALVASLGVARKITADENNLVNELNARLGTTADTTAGVINTFQLFGSETRRQSTSAVASLSAIATAAGIGFNVVADDLATNADQILGTFSGYDTELASAAVQARLLGLDIGKVASVAEGLLDFESSITKEMEAEVLLGRDLNLSALRRAAFLGDAEGVTQGIADLTRQIGSMDSMNFFQKRALADAIGLSVKELQEAHKLQTDLAKLSADERKQFEQLSEAQKSAVSNEDNMKQGLARIRAMKPLLNVWEQIKARVSEFKEMLARPLSRVIEVVLGKMNSIIGKLKAQLNENGGLLPAFEKFGMVVGNILDRIFDKDFIIRVTNFIKAGIEWVKRIVEAASNFFGNVNGIVGLGGSSTSSGDVLSKSPDEKPVASVDRKSANDAVIHSGKIITTHPEDYLIATKKPEELVKDSVVVNQSLPKEFMDMVKNTNKLLNTLLANGIDARVAPKSLNRAVYSQNNVR